MAYHIENAIQLNPRDARAWNLQGVILFNAHSAEVNVHPFDVAIRRCADAAAALSWYALCAAELGGKPHGTSAALSALHLANLSQSLGDTPEATDTMAQAIDLVPSNSVNWKELGRFHLRQGQSRKALRAFEMANRVEEKPIYWLWIACTRRLLKLDESQFDITAAMQSFNYAWRGAIEDGSDALFEQNAFAGFWLEWDKSMPDPKTKPDLDHWKEEIEEKLALLADIKTASTQLFPEPPAVGNPASAAQIASAILAWEHRLAQCGQEQAWHKARINLFLCDLHDKAGDLKQGQRTWKRPQSCSP
jgi:tetratricopeptide (TPR) repeat protein